LNKLVSTELYSGAVEYCFLESEQGRLFAALHHPSKETNSPAIILLNPVFEERTRAHRYLFNWTRYLAHHGYSVLRFDYSGQGDSEGDTADITIESQLEDFGTVYSWMKDKLRGKRIALHGLRWGGVIASLAAQNPKYEIDHLVLWAPIENARDYLMAELRKNLASQLIVHKKVVEDRKSLVSRLESGEAVNVDGYLLSSDFWKQLGLTNSEQLSISRPTLQYKFVTVSDGQEGNDTMTVTDGAVNNLTIMKSALPEFYLETKDYSSSDPVLFESTLQWMKAIG
jgi:exosortase A-associated hydrolase 2